MGMIEDVRARISELTEGKKLSKAQRIKLYKQAWKETKRKYQ